MTELKDAHVLVVGATGGLGSAIARRLADAGARLTLCGRSVERLSALAGDLGPAVAGSVTVELTAPAGPAQAVAAAAANGPVTGVVYAAGVVAFGPVTELDDDVLDELLLLNLIAPMRLARAAVPVLPKGGFLVHLSAVVAERPMPSMAGYSAAKAGLTAFDAAMATELRRRGIRVLDVRPPHTETGLADRPISGQAPTLPTGLDPNQVARRVVQAIQDDEKDLPATSFG